MADVPYYGGQQALSDPRPPLWTIRRPFSTAGELAAYLGYTRYGFVSWGPLNKAARFSSDRAAIQAVRRYKEVGWLDKGSNYYIEPLPSRDVNFLWAIYVASSKTYASFPGPGQRVEAPDLQGASLFPSLEVARSRAFESGLKEFDVVRVLLTSVGAEEEGR